MKIQMHDYTVYTKDGNKIDVEAENTTIINKMVVSEIEMIQPMMGIDYSWRYGRWVRRDEKIPAMDKFRYLLFNRVPPKKNNYI